MFTLWLIIRLDLDALQIILVGTVLEVVVTTCEIPTGVVAESVSRRLSVIVGVGLIGVGFIVFAVPSYPVALASQVIWRLGFTFMSGADIAWITDEVGLTGSPWPAAPPWGRSRGPRRSPHRW